VQSVKIDLPREPEVIEIHVLADFHLGDPFCDEKLVRRQIEIVKSRENAYCILNGDLLNTALKGSVSDCYEEKISPMEQLKLIVGLMEPIAKKCLVITSGNHERRVAKDTSIDLMEIAARELNVPYAADGAVLYVSCGKNVAEHRDKPIVYMIYTTHGSGGGRTEGGKINALAQLVALVDADIYVHSHVHLPGAFKEDYFRTNPNNRTTTRVTKLFVSTAATLDYGGYAQRAKYRPASKDNPVIYLNGRKKEASAIV
jgi:predicted phosphodiesterase